MKHSTIVCIGTSPALTLGQIESARSKGFRLFGVNNVFEIVPDLELLYACNIEWWREYWSKATLHPCEKWQTYQGEKTFYAPDVNHIAEREGDGLCTDPSVIHHGHGSGFSLVSMAHKKGATRIVLLGYSLRYAPDYDGASRSIGSSPRHYFGEYPASMHHWPKVDVKAGVHVGLVRLYRTVRDQGLVELINATPGSALEPDFDFAPIESL